MSAKIFDIFRRVFSIDGWIFIGMLLLTIFGAAAVYSVDLSRSIDFAIFKKHILIVAAGLILFFLIALSDYTFWRATSYWWYIAGIALLIAVLVFGTNIRGTVGWFRIGGFSFQPAEIAKFGTMLMLAFYFSRRSRYFRDTSVFIGSFLAAAIPAFLIFLQPDFGSAMIILGSWAVVLLFLGTRKRYWAIFLAFCFIIFSLMWLFVFKDYQKERVLTFFDPQRDRLGSGYNVTQSTIAVGAGGLLGRGLGFGSQSQLRFLPEAQSDFVFAVIGEELGFVGTMAVIALYAVILGRILLILKRSPDDFASVVLVSTFAFLLAQFIINVGAVLGMLPVTGVPLPLISAGGSSYLVTSMFLGLVESIYRVRRTGI